MPSPDVFDGASTGDRQEVQFPRRFGVHYGVTEHPLGSIIDTMTRRKVSDQHMGLLSDTTGGLCCPGGPSKWKDKLSSRQYQAAKQGSMALIIGNKGRARAVRTPVHLYSSVAASRQMIPK